jgi:hypothetical protein
MDEVTAVKIDDLAKSLASQVSQYLGTLPELDEQDIEDLKALVIGKLAVSLLA